MDAFERNQQGRGPSGFSVPLGDFSRNALLPFAAPGATVTPNGDRTYGRPVVNLNRGGDAGSALVSQGLALPEPRYLEGNALAPLVALQREAIANERGAYAGQYQMPSEFRQLGEEAPWLGKLRMSNEDARALDTLLRDPSATEDRVRSFLAERGQDAENIGNIMSFLRRNPQAAMSPYYQQRDVTGGPVQAAGPGLFERIMSAVNEGLIDFAASPFDLSHAIAKPIGEAVGIDMADESPVSQAIRGGAHAAGVGQRDEGFAPRSDVERYAQSFARGAGSAALPVGGTLAAGSRLALRAPSLATEASAARSAVRQSMVDAARSPGTATALEVGSGAGAYVGGQAADDAAPGNVWASIPAQVVGGMVGGLGAGAAVQSLGRRAGVRAVASGEGPGSGGGQVVRAADGAPLEIPTDPSGFPAVVPTENGYEALIGVENGAPIYGPQSGPDAIASPYRDLALRLNGEDAPAPVNAERLEPPVPQPNVDDDGGNQPATLTLDGAALDGPRIAAMDDETPTPSITGPAFWEGDERVSGPDAAAPQGVAARPASDADKAALARSLDELAKYAGSGPDAEADVRATLDRVGEGYSFEQALGDIRQKYAEQAPDAAASNQRPRDLLGDQTPAERMAAAERVQPGDVIPIPASRVADVDEAANIERGRYAPVRATNEDAELSSRGVQAASGATIRKRGPVDLVGFLRTQGGLKPSGELAHRGIDNAGRKLPFAQGEERLGKLVDPQSGMQLDDAAYRAWEAGYFDGPEPPSVDEFLDALAGTHTGGSGRIFHPEDYAEVDRYNAAQSQRYAVEAARDAGAPLAEDRSQTATLEDVERNTAPVQAYEEWGENAPDFAGNVRLEGLDSPQSIKRALVRVDQVSGGFDAARRGRITRAETERLAADLGMTPADLLKRRKGQALNAEQALAARQILAKSGNELVNMAKRLKAKAGAGEASDADRAAFREAVIRHAAIQEQVAGATAEAGRALSQFRMAADSRAVRGDVLKSLIDAGGGESRIEDAANAIIDNADDPARLNNAAKVAAKQPGKLQELWYNFLLSGPRTHAVNITSNFLTSVAQIPEHAAAAAIGLPRALTQGAHVDRVMFTEAGSRFIGWMQGAREGFAQFAQTMRTGEPSDLASKVEAQSMRAIPGAVGSVIRTPTRLLMAEDELFKAMARRMEVVGLATRKARMEGLRGQAARDRAAELAANPTPEMLEQSAEYGRYLTFQRKLGKGGQAVSNLTSANPWLKLFIPFTRTPINLLKFAAERSPIAPVLGEWRADFQAGGARRDLALARVAVGTGAMALAMEATRQGWLTGGGPADDSAKRLLLADGWQPYSVKVGDTYYSFQRLDPFSTTLGLAADFVDLQSHMTDKEKDQVAAVLVGSTLQNLSSKSWLSGMSNLGEALSDWGRHGDNFVASLAGSTVPAVVGQAAQAMDPTQREARTILDRVRSRIPGASKALPARRDVFGREIPSANGGGVSSFSPIFSRERGNDPTIAALIDAGVQVGVPSRTIGDPDNPGKRIELTPEQYSFYQQSAGEIVKPELDALVAGPDWKAMTTDERQRAVREIVEDARTDAREMVLMQVRPKPTPSAPPPGEAGAPWWINDEPVTQPK